MNDLEFLQWVHDRLQFQHGDDYNMDFMHRLRKIIQGLIPKMDVYPDGWFTHSCEYLVDGIKCDLGLKDGCEHMTSDVKCCLVTRRLEVAEYLQSSISKVKKENEN